MPKKVSDITLTSSDLTRIAEYIQGLIDRIPEEISKLLVSEFAEQKRILPENTPHPGKWKNWRTPYSVEIMDSLSARSPVQEVIWIKASQIGATAAVENFIAYIISEVPGPTLYVSAKEDLLRKWVNKRFNPLIKSCKLESYIRKQHVIEGGRATGNQQFSKEFPGGSLDIVSAQSESNLRMDSIRYLVLDEAGAYPWNIQGFGDPIEIARARTANFESRKKIFIPSTPGMEGECRMWPLYKEGDMRRFFVPCLECGEGFVLKFPSEPEMYYEGLPAANVEWETKAGILQASSIHFKCPHCGHANMDADKFNLISGGAWRPTAEPRRPKTRSYQIGRLYSLMDSWERLVQIERTAIEDPLTLQTHHNHNAGIPYLPKTARPDKAKIYNLRSAYRSGEVPTEKVLFATAAVDVQIGKKNDPNKPPRLEMEICGHGFAYRTWSLQYKVFPGAVHDPYDGAWEDFYNWMLRGGMECRRDDGFIIAPSVIFIDAGGSDKETTVFDFCSRLKGAYPVRGAAELQKTAQGKKMDFTLDEPGPKTYERFRINTKYDQEYIMILTTWYKERLWRALQIERQPTGEQRPRFCEFPSDYPSVYFDMLVAEERREGGVFWKPESRPNESLDLRVYNMAACDFHLYQEVQRVKLDMLRKGFTKEQASYTRSRHILDMMAKAVARKGVK